MKRFTFTPTLGLPAAGRGPRTAGKAIVLMGDGNGTFAAAAALAAETSNAPTL